MASSVPSAFSGVHRGPHQRWGLLNAGLWSDTICGLFIRCLNWGEQFLVFLKLIYQFALAWVVPIRSSSFDFLIIHLEYFLYIVQGMAQWIRYLLPSLIIWVHCMRPTWWKERIDFHHLPSGLTVCTIAFECVQVSLHVCFCVEAGSQPRVLFRKMLSILFLKTGSLIGWNSPIPLGWLTAQSQKFPSLCPQQWITGVCTMPDFFMSSVDWIQVLMPISQGLYWLTSPLIWFLIVWC